jgi:hypothetical protein
MKQSAPERDDGYENDNAMADEPQLSRTDDQDSSDDETVKGERDEHHIADILEEELQAPGTPVPPLGNGSIAHRYREIVKEAEADTVSEEGSTDAIPRRAGSPIDSLLSIPDDTPSVQVGGSYTAAVWGTNTLSGLRHILSWQQRAPLSSLKTRPQQPDAILPPLRPQIPVPHIITVSSLPTTFISQLSRQSQSNRLPEQPVAARSGRNRHPFASVGGCTMDKAAEAQWPGLFRGW